MVVWLGQSISQVADRIHNLVLTWWILQRTNDAAMVGQILLAASLPQVLFAPLGGTLADRWNRKSILIASNLARATIVAALAVADFSGKLTVPELFLATAAINTIAAIFQPTLFATIPSLVEESQVMRASSLQDAVANGAGILGPALGGVIVATVGPPSAFALDAICYVIAGTSVLLAAIPPPPVLARGSPGLLAQLSEGIGYIRAMPTILGMIVVFGFLNFFAAPIAIYLPYYAKAVFGRDADALGAMEASLSVGLVVAGVVLATRSVDRKASPILVSILVAGLLFIVLGLAPSFGPCLVVLFALGLAIGIANILILVYFQQTVPNDRLGRVMGIVTTVTTAAQPPAFALAGVLLARVSVPSLAIGSGIGVFVGALYLIKVPGFRQI
jgi:MFS family permease